MTRFAPDAKLSLAHLSELQVPPAELLRIAARAGFASVGFRTLPASPGGIVYPLASVAEQREIAAAVNDTGVSVLYIELVSIDAALDVRQCRAALEVGAAIGATRLAVAGDSGDIAMVADKMAALCVLAAEYGIAVDLEFMPYRPIATLADALAVVRRAAQPNAHVLLDALHFFRSGSALDDLRTATAQEIGSFQICDAPALAPPHDALVTEARTHRLLPGHGGLALRALIAATPPGLPLGVEIPLAAAHPDLAPAARLAMLVTGTRNFLALETRA